MNSSWGHAEAFGEEPEVWCHRGDKDDQREDDDRQAFVPVEAEEKIEVAYRLLPAGMSRGSTISLGSTNATATRDTVSSGTLTNIRSSR